MKRVIILKTLLVAGAFLILSPAFGQQLRRTAVPQENTQKQKTIAGEKTVKQVQVQPTEKKTSVASGSVKKQQKASPASAFPTHMQNAKNLYETTFGKQLSEDEFKKTLKSSEANLAAWKKVQLHYKDNKEVDLNYVNDLAESGMLKLQK